MGNYLDPIDEASYETLRQALTNHISQTNGEARFVGDFFIVAASYGDSAEHVGYSYISSDSVPHALEGLIYRGLRALMAEEATPRD